MLLERILSEMEKLPDLRSKDEVAEALEKYRKEVCNMEDVKEAVYALHSVPKNIAPAGLYPLTLSQACLSLPAHAVASDEDFV